MRFLWAQTAPKQLDIRYPLMYSIYRNPNADVIIALSKLI